MARFKKNRIVWEILIMSGAWILISLSLTNGLEYPERFIKQLIPALIGFVLVIQINARFLLPRLFFLKKYSLYILSSIFLLSITVLILHHQIFPWSSWFRVLPMTPEGMPRPTTDRLFGVRWMKVLTPLIIALLGSTLVAIMRFANTKEKERVEAELKFLKSQVNPHFLFNALNNIYSLAVVESPQTPESIMQLSEILRYMVYDSNEEKVLLENEMTYIENFIELQMLKDSRGMDVELDLDKSVAHKMVAPLLFIPFVENAFKHSKIENLKEGFIKIQLKGKEKSIEFRVVNSIPKDKFTKDEVGGVGLENTRKRLELVHPNGEHELITNETDNQFEVILKITV